LHVPETPQDLQRLIERFSDRSVVVFLSGQLADQDRSAFLATINASVPRPALIQVQETSGDDMLVSGDVLGTLRLPCQYDAISALMHKAQVFAESQRHGESPRRPLELFRSLSGNSRATRGINKMIEQVADTEATVLILGESGTGKEVVARKLHYHSKRRGRPFVPVNCGAIPGDLLESELFGHEKGAFTGAITSRQGRFELAEGGTLFLDEIGDMSLHMQVKLLRVLQEGEVLRVGATQPIACDVRFIAASNRDVAAAVQSGRFRQDLYYRLNVVGLHLPGLRQRPDDIALLAQHFLRKYAAQMKRRVSGISPQALSLLSRHTFPGNVRELENLVARGAALATGDTIGVEELPETLAPQSISPAPSHHQPDRLPTLQEQENEYIERVLAQADGNQTVAARILGINRASLWRKLKARRARPRNK
jgi:sigma-54 specific flagellar transcriptional regulator A